MRSKMIERDFRMALSEGYDPYDSLKALHSKWRTARETLEFKPVRREIDANRFLRLQA